MLEGPSTGEPYSGQHPYRTLAIHPIPPRLALQILHSKLSNILLAPSVQQSSIMTLTEPVAVVDSVSVGALGGDILMSANGLAGKCDKHSQTERTLGAYDCKPEAHSLSLLLGHGVEQYQERPLYTSQSAMRLVLQVTC